MIKQLRSEKGITQQELGQIVGVKQLTISRYEIGIREPTLDVLIMLADYFGVTTDYLLGRNIHRKRGETK